MDTRRNRSFVVLGGVGTIGRVVVRDLFASHPMNRILVADFNQDTARAFARTFRSRRVRFAFADASKPLALADVLRGAAVVINCTQHDFNLHVMRAALRAGTHYVDLGGLFHWTRRQLKLNPLFQHARLTAVLGMGCAPGITNVLARSAANQLDRVASVKIRVGTRVLSAPSAPFAFPYSAQTIVEEFTLKPTVFENGRFRQVAPRTGWEQMAFPHPVGRVWLLRTRHSEVATLPGSLRKQGIRSCDFKVSFDRGFVREVMKRLRAGWTMQQFRALTISRDTCDDAEVARVIVRGRRQGRPITITMDCMATSKPTWHASAGDVDTGCPPSIVAQMIADGTIATRGVFPPEVVVPIPLFLMEIRQRGLRVTRHIKNG